MTRARLHLFETRSKLALVGLLALGLGSALFLRREPRPRFPTSARPPSAVEVDTAVTQALAFLETTQDGYGEFRSTVCDKKDLCYIDSTPFITTFVLNSLTGLRSAQVDRMRVRALDFLQSEMLPGGLWRFWTFRAPYTPILQPDLDDTATVADVLLTEGKMPVDNRALILRNEDLRGRFLTWLLPTEKSAIFDFDPASRLRNAELRPTYGKGPDHEGRVLLWMRRNEFPNETDSTVNANVLLYLREEIPTVCAYLNEAIATGEASVYYLGRPAQYYMYGRAYGRGIHCLEPSRSVIVNGLLKMQQADGSFGSAENTALALSTLRDFGYRGRPTEMAARYLVSSQRSDGSWPDDFFFKESAYCKDCHYWRSTALSSSLAIEALLAFRNP